MESTGANAETPSSSGASDTAEEQGPATPLPQSHHRRTASEEFGTSHDHGSKGYQYPPKQIWYNLDGAFATEDENPNGFSIHNRTRTWSGSHPYPGNHVLPPYSFSPGMQPPPPSAFSPSGNPLVPMLLDPSVSGGAMVPPQTGQYTSPQRKRSHTGHRRVHSYSGVPTYGSLGGVGPATTPVQPPPIPSGRSRDFSPRSEIMKLTASFRSTPGSSSSPRRSPNGSYMGVPGSTAIPSGSFLRTDDGRVSFSPGTPMAANSFENGSLGVYGMDGGPSIIPTSPMNAPTHSHAGGEAVFLAKKGKNRKSPSARKMHMRQRSAQLFMEDVKGVEQLPACRDIIFLMLFVFHLLGIVYLGNTYGFEGLRYHDEMDSDSTVTIVYSNVIYISCLSGGLAVVISALALLLMTAIARKIVQIALILTITLSFAWGTIGVGLSPKKIVPATGIIALALSVAYTFIVWDRIPFAAANLNSGLNGIRANPGAVIITFFFQFLALGWSIYYSYVGVGVYDAMEEGDIDLTFRGMKVAVYAALGLSYYWTLQVFLNIVQVTVAGIIGAWWFTEEGDTSTRSADLTRCFFRSSFYAIGSICFGSLLVGPIRLLRQLSAFFRPSEKGSSLLCLHECLHCVQACLTSFVDSLAERFNPWAFTYVGLYGYSLIDAGLNATELFEKRGWSTIVSDDLVPNVLLMTSLVIGGITGCFAHLIENIEALSLTSLHNPVGSSFSVGFLVGVVVSSVLFGIISSSVSAVIVCFAASPVDFEQNHPKLSQEMRTAWREVWPGCMEIVDMRLAVASYLDPTMNGNGEHQPLLP